jgi:hypothetical protein
MPTGGLTAGTVLPQTDKNPICLRKGLNTSIVLLRTNNNRAATPTEPFQPYEFVN